MGCCLSSTEQERHHSDGGAIPAPVEEETVKEVLLETPFSPKTLNTDQFIGEKGPGNRELQVDFEPPPPTTNVLIQTNPQKTDNEETVSEVVSNDNECYCNTTASEKNDGDVNQRPPGRKRRQPVGGKRRVPARAPVAPEKTSQVRPFRGGQLRSEGSVQRNMSPVTRGERGMRRNMSEGMGNTGGSNGGVFGEEAETLENPVVSLECFIFL